jgi:lysophospholipase L1-like esterase
MASPGHEPAAGPGRGPAASPGRWLRLSVAANILFLLAGAALGVRFWMRRKTSVDRYAQERESYFAALPPREGATVFAGDSITDRGEFAEMFGDATFVNRGISSDTTAGVLARLDGIAANRPARIWLLIGVNDLLNGEAIPAIDERYGRILDGLAARAPGARLFCNSILPVREVGALSGGTNAKIRDLNAAIARTAKSHGCAFVDVTADLADAGGALDARYTLDGIHLSGEGFAAWSRAIDRALRVPR